MPRLRRAFTLIELLVVVAIILILCACLGADAATFQAVFAGWIYHLRRLAAESSFDANNTLLTLVCLVILISGVHLIARSWKRDAGADWKLRWSVCLSLGVVVLAAAGIAGLSLVHQTYWLATGPPLLEGHSIRVFGERTQSANNLKQMGIGVHAFHDSPKNLPGTILSPSSGEPIHGWGTMLLPYIEQDALYKSIRLDVPWTRVENQAAFRKEVLIFRYPAADGPKPGELAPSNYAANVYVLNATRRSLSDISDGTSYTLLFGEAAGAFRPWGHPCNWRDPGRGLNTSPEGFGHPRGKNVMMGLADGSVRQVSDAISPSVLKALATPDGGEKIDDAEW